MRHGEGVNALRKLPYIEDKNQKLLARNIGVLDVSKDDVWLQRVADKLKVRDVLQLTTYLAGESGEKQGVVDKVLWPAVPI
jgi:hypothetical protein